MKRLLISILLLVLVAGGYYYFRYLRDTPIAALMQAARATQTHDVATFDRFVDVESVTNGMVDDVASQGSILGALVPGGGFALRGGLGLLKPQLAKAAHTEVERFVETGSVEAATANAPKRLLNVSFLGLIGRIVGPGSTFKGIKYTTTTGDEARVGVEFTRPQFDTTLVADIALKRQPDGHWQVKRITNTGTLLRQAVRLEK
ncbi:hypothetical protein HHL22_16945 [Hymenobacter sp. RP-2-7]|uniref:DUF2939 domain-containing protein n=1 Tax=Hymenobacter polaris TaxID=2682546 RepID=A0A7Y0AGG4_9BACT|nr:hypothetical protein [Hymenobacter polaris]NML66895.1 hypothetical protein [Hymenobacter polaris]